MNEDDIELMDDEFEVEILEDDEDERHAQPPEDTLADPYIPDEAA